MPIESIQTKKSLESGLGLRGESHAHVFALSRDPSSKWASTSHACGVAEPGNWRPNSNHSRHDLLVSILEHNNLFSVNSQEPCYVDLVFFTRQRDVKANEEPCFLRPAFGLLILFPTSLDDLCPFRFHTRYICIYNNPQFPLRPSPTFFWRLAHPPPLRSFIPIDTPK